MDLHDARRNEDIHHNLYGGRRVMMDRPDGGRAFYERGRPGYLGRPYQAHGVEFNRRTYYYQGRAYDRFYRPYNYHGYALEAYVPQRYYGPAFYGWAYNPWAPVSYSWGFGRAAWYGYYGAYFTPYPVYSSPALWVTDYTISQSLAEGYAAQQEAGEVPPQPYAGAALSPQVKDLLAQEVQRDIALESGEAQGNARQQVPDPNMSGIGRLMTDGQPHVFLADREVDVTDANGQECAVTDGDVVMLRHASGPSDTTEDVTVLASKGGKDCAMGSQVAIGIDELSEMNNNLRARIDSGLEELQRRQGTGGLPKAPAGAVGSATPALVAEGAPPPDLTGSRELEALAAQSTRDEGELVKEAQVGAVAPGPEVAGTGTAVPLTFSLEKGKSLEEVEAALGAPTKVVKMGNKSLYYFGDVKVMIVGNKVSQVLE